MLFLNDPVSTPDVGSRPKSSLSWEDLAKAAQFDAKELAKLCCVSVRTLQRYFKRNDLQLSAWLRQLRLHIARESLLSGKSVKEAAIDARYFQLSNFSRDFKKAYGVSPRFFVHGFSQGSGSTNLGVVRRIPTPFGSPSEPDQI